MKKLAIAVGTACLLLAAPGRSQVSETSPQKPRPTGYVYFGGSTSSGDLTDLLTVGAGGEGFLYKGFAAGADIGYLFASGRFTTGMGLASVNGSYHFANLDTNGKWIPFVTAGYSVAFRDGAASMPNYGGGLTYWVRPRVGLRAEIRNHHHSDLSLVAFRGGVSFR